MPVQWIDGRALAATLRHDLADRIQRSKNLCPKLAVILVGDHPASHIYVRNKIKACQDVGIHVDIHPFPTSVVKKDLIKVIRDLNENSSVHGILLQLPLPPFLDPLFFIEEISPLKDVDGLHPENLGRLCQNHSRFIPCTPQGCLHLLSTVHSSDLRGKTVAIVGRSLLVGRPLAALLTNHNATVHLLHSHTPNLKEWTRQADIVIVATGIPQWIDASFIQKGATVIDVGINEIIEQGERHVVGDVDNDSVASVAGYLTPVPGGVGPMTIACLLLNVVKAAQNHLCLTASPE